jgi:PPM family protein phosphatase
LLTGNQKWSSGVKSQGLSELAALFETAQKALRSVADRDPSLKSMGSTLSVLRLYGATAQVGHVGDSRIYHLRGDGIVGRTVDQTEVEQLVQQGVLSKAGARRYPRRHVLLSVLSPPKDYDLYNSEFQIKAGDRVILLTDGVSSKLLRLEIRDISLRHTNTKSFCQTLVNEITGRNPADDYSAICIDIAAI